MRESVASVDGVLTTYKKMKQYLHLQVAGFLVCAELHNQLPASRTPAPAPAMLQPKSQSIPLFFALIAVAP